MSVATLFVVIIIMLKNIFGWILSNFYFYNNHRHLFFLLLYLHSDRVDGHTNSRMNAHSITTDMFCIFFSFNFNLIFLLIILFFTTATSRHKTVGLFNFMCIFCFDNHPTMTAHTGLRQYMTKTTFHFKSIYILLFVVLLLGHSLINIWTFIDIL